MNISTGSRSMIATAQQRDAVRVFPVKPAGEKPADIALAFNATERRFGESFDCSTHAAVIKLMMMTFGQRPAAMFNELVPSGDGYNVTMKDEFKLHLSRQELQQASQASRFAGADSEVVKDANFVFAAFVKRKQLTGGYATFEAALSKTLEGETPQRCLQGMGVFGLSQFVSVNDMAGQGAVGVLETHNRGAALVREGVRHDGGAPQKANRGYGYILFNDRASPPSNRDAVPVVPSIRPADIWSGFYQGVEGNCVTVSAIKAAMIRFGQDPGAIYKQVQITPAGYDVVMRDSFRLQLTHEEVRQAAAESNFYGGNRQLLDAAHFLYAVSAKRAQIENNDFRARESYATALQTLNDGEFPGEALRRLGLFGYLRESTVAELAKGAVGTLADNGHSVAVIDGVLDFYGEKQDLASSRWMNSGFRALKLV